MEYLAIVVELGPMGVVTDWLLIIEESGYHKLDGLVETNQWFDFHLKGDEFIFDADLRVDEKLAVLVGDVVVLGLEFLGYLGLF